MNPSEELRELGDWLCHSIPEEPGPLSTHMAELSARAARATALKAHFGEILREAKGNLIADGYPAHVTLASEKKIWLEARASRELSDYEKISGFCVNIHERAIACGSLRKAYVAERYHG